MLHKQRTHQFTPYGTIDCFIRKFDSFTDQISICDIAATNYNLACTYFKKLGLTVTCKVRAVSVKEQLCQIVQMSECP